MPEVLDPTAPAADDVSAPVDDGTASAPIEDPTAKIIEDYRKRQSGAEKARLEAERVAAAYKAELDRLNAGKPAAKPTGDDAEAQFAAQLEAIKQENAKALEKMQGEFLSARFPAARAKFPEITDTVKLAELEAMFGEAPAAPAPVGNNPQRAQAPAAKRPEDMSIAELEQYIKTGFDKSVMGLS